MLFVLTSAGNVDAGAWIIKCIVCFMQARVRPMTNSFLELAGIDQSEVESKFEDDRPFFISS